MGVPDVSYPTDEEDWAGCLTLPRELTVRGRRLIQQPLPELKKLREEKLPFEANEAGCYALPRAAEVELDCRKGDVSLHLFTDAAGQGGLSILYKEEAKEITVDRSGMKIRFNESEGESRTRTFLRCRWHRGHPAGQHPGRSCLQGYSVSFHGSG